MLEADKRRPFIFLPSLVSFDIVFSVSLRCIILDISNPPRLRVEIYFQVRSQLLSHLSGPGLGNGKALSCMCLLVRFTPIFVKSSEDFSFFFVEWSQDLWD